MDELTPAVLLAAAAAAVHDRRLAEVAEIELAIQWAVLHGHPAGERDAMATPGGDGTPQVRVRHPGLAMARESTRPPPGR